jgi:uncharacterized Tic20 family protein
MKGTSVEQNNMVTEIDESRAWAAAVHFSLLLTGFVPLGSLIFPVLVSLKKSDDEFIKAHSSAAINFSIILTVFGLITVFGRAVMLEQVQNAGAIYLLEATSLPFTLLYFVILGASWVEGITNGLAALKGEPPNYKFILKRKKEGNPS